MKKLYSYGEFDLPIKAGFSVKEIGWFLTDKELPATNLQQRLLKLLGWGKDESMSIKGANTIITSILETLEN